MNQIVYVVADVKKEVVIGVYNEYKDALATLPDNNSKSVSITPVLVDATPDASREMCYNEEDVIDSTEIEIEFAAEIEAEEDEDEDEYNDYDGDYGGDDEDEDELYDEDEEDRPDPLEILYDIKAVLDAALI